MRTLEGFDDSILANLDGEFSREAAHSILQLQFSQSQKSRLSKLAEKARAGELSPTERTECESFERVSSLLGILQSRARMSLA